ncbi:DUF4166 domain-containing protein [Variovorax atrisoli]|uniref:DUF4166 domain-containing protein n=1 Tax=Variovorax atrisoli TaxID=3394203 RepID=UPI003AB0D059
MFLQLRRPVPPGELFKKILGAAWLGLHPDIRRRFDKNPSPGKALHYLGSLSELRCSRFGKLLGHITQPMIQGALIPYSDADFPVEIQVYARPQDPAIYKQRITACTAAGRSSSPASCARASAARCWSTWAWGWA